MGPMNLSAYKLAQSIHVPTSRIQDILHNRRKISADTSIRLGRFFGVSDRFFLDMQNDIEIRELIEKLDGDITTIKPYTAVAMYSAWQHFGNRKSDSPCFMDNQWNQNTRSHQT